MRGETAFRRVLFRMEGQIWRRSLGVDGKVRRQAVVPGPQEADQHQETDGETGKGTAMAHAELTQAAAGEAMSPRCRSLAASLEASLGRLVEIPAAVLAVAEIVIRFSGVVGRYELLQRLT